MFIDEVTIKIEGGAGGNGKATFFPNRGGPSGGNGGHGGNVYAVVNPQMSHLNKYSGKAHLTAESGGHGGGNRMAGKNGDDLIIDLPKGSMLIDIDTRQEVELIKEDQKIRISRGGRGGLGNDALKSATTSAPQHGEPGTPGEVRNIKIILRLIADYGFIGIPNAGKSTLLNELTAANVRTADYPFTTLEPSLGVLGAKVLADIPGLIEGASSGKGLGIKFLKHIEKVSLLLHCISAESTDLTKDYKTIKNELEAYNPALAKKDEIVLLTKTDLIDEKEIAKKVKELKKLNPKVYPISVADDKSLEALKKVLLH